MASDSDSGRRSPTASPTLTDADRIVDLQESVKRIEVSRIRFSGGDFFPEVSGNEETGRLERLYRRSVMYDG